MGWAAALSVFVLSVTVAGAETDVFSQSLKDATRVLMEVANPHGIAANAAFEAGDMPVGCAEAKLAYDGYTDARQIFRKALQHYEAADEDPQRIQVVGYLNTNIDAMTRHRLPYELFLTNVCPSITGIPAPVDR